ncbi:MAG: transcriptional regulatory [uncultured Thermomicrobiales bacterium]|uniref:Transcriptional regulatory n=1 Tax=uncultured Thermomicrobiales bacterium TaxID=1645740 RepID=A0A6J4VNH6_9BACT|nr:MAG: transcriptional regulatory [uncultured Thermomicrobiales bacterium]
MELLERDSFLTELGRLLRDATNGNGRLLFLGGEAGIGKTTLVAQFGGTARRTARVLVGACDPLSTPRPLGPLADIVGVLRGEVERLLLASAPRDQVFRAFLAVLADGSGPTLVVFEDVHWADEATLDLLRFLGRRIGSTRGFLLATYRDDEVGPTHPLRIALGDLATTASVRRLTLPPLSERAVGALAEGSDVDPAELYRLTAGNPFFVTEVLAGGAHGIPPTVRDAVLARVARLSAAGRAALDAAAVIGARVEPWLLAEVAGPEAAAATNYVESGLLRAEGRVLAFRHELAREAVRGAIPPPRLLALHRAVLAALLREHGGAVAPARLAHHAEAAHDGPATLRHAEAAAQEAIHLSAHREAAAQYARALRAGGVLEPMRRAALLGAYSHECHNTDDLAEAVRACREAIAIWRELGDRLNEGEQLGRLATLLVVSGRNAEAEEAIDAALTLLEALPASPQLALAYRARAHLRMLDRDSASAIAWGGKALALAERLGARGTTIAALNTIGSAMLVAGDLAGRDPLERSAALARAADLDDQVALAFVNLGSALGEQYHFELAGHYLDEGIA